MLVELHGATPVVAAVARTIGLEVPGRRHIEAALRELKQTWSGGPFSEAARHAFASRSTDVVELLALADRLAADVARRGCEWVITHGEPHFANVMRTATSYVLVDWDTVALAPPERDLWMVVDEATGDATIYTDATGHEVNQDALNFFRLTWDLRDLAEYLDVLRSPHTQTEDTLRALEGVQQCVVRDRWEALLR